jgi:hypothetical protein
MNADIDWAWVLINLPIFRYFDRYEALDLSLSNKNIREKLYPLIFKQMEINSRVLERYPNYFNQTKYFQFDNLSYMEKINKFKKYGLNNQLAFKEIQIDPFIETAKDTLRSASIHCKSLKLFFAWGIANERVSFFIFPLFEKFYNLNKLALDICKIPFIKLSNLLTKLENLEILSIERVSLMLVKSENTNLSLFLQFPKSLKELTYIGVFLGFSPSYQDSSLLVLKEPWVRHETVRLKLMPQSLPNLKLLKFLDPNPDTGRMREFIALNPNVEYINEY